MWVAPTGSAKCLKSWAQAGPRRGARLDTQGSADGQFRGEMAGVLMPRYREAHVQEARPMTPMTGSAPRATLPSKDDDGLAGFEDVILLLWNGKDHEALSIVEQWTCWPTDADLVIVLEAYYRCERPECIPILQRMLTFRPLDERDEADLVGRLERARTWE